MTGPRVVITQQHTPKAALENAWALLHEKGPVLTPDAAILVVIDCPIPQGFPASVNPDTLIALITLLQANNFNSITLLPTAFPGIKRERIFPTLGLDDIILKYNANLPDWEQWNADPQQYLRSFPNKILLTQIRADVGRGLWMASMAWTYLAPPDTPEIQKILDSLQKISPTLTINDAFYILEGNGPNIQTRTNAKRTETIILGTDMVASDIVTARLFKLKPLEIPILATILNSSLDVPGKDEKAINIISSQTIRNPSFIPVQYSLSDPQLPGVHICQGEMTEDLFYQATQLLISLESICIKDASHIGDWALLLGKSPPNPPPSMPIVIFGDEAIQTTATYAFRREIKQKKVLSDDEVDNMVFRNDSMMRERIMHLEARFEEIKTQINEKDDPFERDEALIIAKKKLEYAIQKERYKQKLFEFKTRFANNKANIANLVPSIKLNEKILEIPGNPPRYWDAFKYLSEFFSPYDAPTLRLFVDVTTQYYNYPDINLALMKANWKRLQQQLKQEMEAKFAPLKIEMKTKLKELSLANKAAVKEAKIAFTAIKHEITKKFAPDLLDVKSRKNAEKQRLKAEKQALKTTKQEAASDKPIEPSDTVAEEVSNHE
jgi:hypothetical protein